MSIFIKGMEMPWCEHQEIDIRRGTDGKWYAIDGDWYEIIPVSDHGRLINADKLQQIIVEDIEEYSELDENGLHSGQWCGIMTAKMEIEAMPIVGTK